jgi:hypothetical protein
MVKTKKVSQTSSERTKQTTQFSSLNIEDEQVHIEKNRIQDTIIDFSNIWNF